MRVTLPFPPSANAAWRAVVIGGNVRVLLSRDGKAFKRDAASWLQAQRTEVLEGDVGVWIVVFFPNRRGDLDNRAKPILDVLQGECFHNDSQVVYLSLTREIDKANPRTEVTVRPVTPDLFSEEQRVGPPDRRQPFRFDMEF